MTFYATQSLPFLAGVSSSSLLLLSSEEDAFFETFFNGDFFRETVLLSGSSSSSSLESPSELDSFLFSGFFCKVLAKVSATFTAAAFSTAGAFFSVTSSSSELESSELELASCFLTGTVLQKNNVI